MPHGSGSTVRIGNAQGFWGDRPIAAVEMLAREPDLDYLTLDYLAEVSMSILASQQARDPEAGYARDFVDVVRSLAGYWSAGGRCRIVTNAGGLNPHGCAAACRAALEAAGCREMKLAVVSGDDVLPALRGASGKSSVTQLFSNLDSGAPLSEVVDRLVTANAYLGAAPVIEALKAGADIVITGRVADPSLTVAPAAHHFCWKEDDWTRLAGATIAGHLIECGTQVTGGLLTDWLDVPTPASIGFPIAEISADGSCVITKPRESGGLVNQWTVKEQLLYEIGDPRNYLSPDVTLSLDSVRVEDLGEDRVRVSGAVGRPRPDTYKVSATWQDGFRSAGTLTIFGTDAPAKARRCGEIVIERVRADGAPLRDWLVECLGTGACAPGVVPEKDSRDLLEVVLRIAVEADTREAVERFSRELAPLVTAGPSGTTGYAEGRPRIHPVIRYWPCLIERSAVTPRVEILDVPARSASSAVRPLSIPRSDERDSPTTIATQVRSTTKRTLQNLAQARSGDKGTGANIGVIARTNVAFRFLDSWLTAERVKEYFLPLGVESVVRYDLPNLEAWNFVLTGILNSRLRTDAQGKALGQALLQMPLPTEAP